MSIDSEHQEFSLVHDNNRALWHLLVSQKLQHTSYKLTSLLMAIPNSRFRGRARNPSIRSCETRWSKPFLSSCWCSNCRSTRSGACDPCCAFLNKYFSPATMARVWLPCVSCTSAERFRVSERTVDISTVALLRTATFVSGERIESHSRSLCRIGPPKFASSGAKKCLAWAAR